MPKKRVHELAKELNLENKDLIARLEKIGITVKSHSSSLEDDEVEKIKDVLLTSESRQIVEERIKSTVIRRRAVRTPKDAPALEEADHPEAELAEKPEDESLITPSEKAGKDKKEEVPKPPVLGTPAAFVEIKKKIPKSEAEAAAPAIKGRPAAETIEGEKFKQPSIVPSKPPIISKHKITHPETKKGIPPKAPLKPGEKIIIPPPEKQIKKEFEKPKKKGKGPVEVFIEEEKVVPRRKVLEKKIEKKLRKQDEENRNYRT